MSRAVFLDTSAWLAALSTREARHAEVAACYADLVRSGARLVTTNLVLAETTHCSSGAAVPATHSRCSTLRVMTRPTS